MSALERAARQTAGTGSACLGERAHHVVADTELRDSWADGSHDPRDFAAQDRGRRNETRVRGEQQVGVAQSDARTSTRTSRPNGAAMSTLSRSNPRPTPLSTSAFIASSLACRQPLRPQRRIRRLAHMTPAPNALPAIMSTPRVPSGKTRIAPIAHRIAPGQRTINRTAMAILMRPCLRFSDRQ